MTCLPSCEFLLYRVLSPGPHVYGRQTSDDGRGAAWAECDHPLCDQGRGASSVLSLSLQCWVTPVCSILRSSVHHWRPAVPQPVRAHYEAAMVSNFEARLSFSINQIGVTKQWKVVVTICLHTVQVFLGIERSLQAPKISLLLYRMPSLLLIIFRFSLVIFSLFIFKRNWVKWPVGYLQIYYQQLIKIIGQYPDKISGNGFSGTRNNFFFLCF